MNVIRNNKSLKQMESEFVRSYQPVTAWGNAAGAFLMLPYLRAFWPMSAVDSGGNAMDLTGEDRLVSYGGNPLYSLSGLAPYINLDGVGDYLYRTDEGGLDVSGTETYVASVYRGLTLGGWFWLDAVATSGLVSKWVESGNQRSYCLLVSTNKPALSVSTDGSAVVSVTAASAITASAWYFVVGRFDPSSDLAVFVNGVKSTNTVGIPASIYNSSSELRIGSYDGGNYLNGRASLCFLCAANLPDGMIQALYQSTRALYGV